MGDFYVARAKEFDCGRMFLRVRRGRDAEGVVPYKGGGGLRGANPSVSFADTSPFRGGIRGVRSSGGGRSP